MYSWFHSRRLGTIAWNPRASNTPIVYWATVLTAMPLIKRFGFRPSKFPWTVFQAVSRCIFFTMSIV